MEYVDRVLVTPKKCLLNERYKSDRLSPMKKPFYSSPIKNFSNFTQKNDLHFNKKNLPEITSPIKKNHFRKDLPSEPYQKVPFQDISSNFYSNPLDWSSKDIIGVVQDKKIILYSSRPWKIVYNDFQLQDTTSIKFSNCGNFLNIGSNDGVLRVFDIEAKIINYMASNIEYPITFIDTNDKLIISGHTNGGYTLLDIRSDDEIIKFGEFDCNAISAIKFSPNQTNFISCSESAIAKIWDIRNLEKSILDYKGHISAIRALDWCPYDSNIIVTGGGTGDRTIQLWNTINGEIIIKKWTGSQVCNIFWNNNYKELVSTHGFGDCSISLWKSDDLSNVQSYYVNKNRVLFASISPDKSKLLSVAPEELGMFCFFFTD